MNPAALDQIVINLISNAVKFTRRGSVSVEISADGDRAYVDVQDTGTGISESFLPHIFDEYRQESQGIGREFEGSGLGMTIVKRLLDRTGGQVAIESEKGVGTSVRVSLPLVSPQHASGARKSTGSGVDFDDLPL